MTQSSGPLRVGIGGPVGAGKTTLTEKLCAALAGRCSMAVITNDIYTREDAEYLMRRRFWRVIASGAWKPGVPAHGDPGGCVDQSGGSGGFAGEVSRSGADPDRKRRR